MSSSIRSTSSLPPFRSQDVRALQFSCDPYNAIFQHAIFLNSHNHSTLLFTSDPSESILSTRQEYRLCVHINKYRQQMIHFRIEIPRFFVLEHAPTLYGRHSYLRTALDFLNTNLLST